MDELLWRIYFADGSTFDSLQGTPWDAPGGGVGCVAVKHPDAGRRIIYDYDWYVWACGQWMFCNDIYSVLRRLIYEPREVRILPGQYMPDDAWKELYNRAADDPGLPVKTGLTPDEVRYSDHG